MARGRLPISPVENRCHKRTGVKGFIDIPDTGGGVYLEESDAVFVRCVFTDNKAVTLGGAVTIWGGSPSFVNCRFHGNDGGRWKLQAEGLIDSRRQAWRRRRIRGEQDTPTLKGSSNPRGLVRPFQGRTDYCGHGNRGRRPGAPGLAHGYSRSAFQAEAGGVPARWDLPTNTIVQLFRLRNPKTQDLTNSAVIQPFRLRIPYSPTVSEGDGSGASGMHPFMGLHLFLKVVACVSAHEAQEHMRKKSDRLVFCGVFDNKTLKIGKSRDKGWRYNYYAESESATATDA